MLDKCKDRRLDIILKDTKSECDRSDMKCFNERTMKEILVDARSSDAAFKSELQKSHVVSASASKVEFRSCALDQLKQDRMMNFSYAHTLPLHVAIRGTARQAKKEQDDAAATAAAKAAFHSQKARAYEEAEQRRLFELRVRVSACRNVPVLSRRCSSYQLPTPHSQPHQLNIF
jgi:hypothetical protein